VPNGWFKDKHQVHPDKFFYIKIGKVGNGTCGIQPRENKNIDPWNPFTWERFECIVNEKTVTIYSYNTSEPTVEPGKTKHGCSLGLEAEVTVIWNGKQAYKGRREQSH